jgi:hypothetical protein
MEIPLSMCHLYSRASPTITFQFMEAIQSEFWEAIFTPKSTEGQTIETRYSPAQCMGILCRGTRRSVGQWAVFSPARKM